MRRIVSAVVLGGLLLPAGLTCTWAMTKPKSVIVRGQVTDPDGKAVSQVPVQVIATRRVVKFLTVESAPSEAVIATATTDDNGFYEVTVPKLRDYDFYYVRFYDADGFDAIKFSMPDDVEITSRINKRRPVIVDEVLTFAPGWDAVQRLVALYGPDTVRGRIIRELGVPERTERLFTDAGVERESWWYEKAGVVYLIEDGKVVEKKTFQPNRESAALASE